MQMEHGMDGEPQSLRWFLGLTTVVVVSLIMVLVDAPELISGRWIVGVMIVPAVGALLLLNDQSRWRTASTLFLVLLAAFLLATAVLNVADLYVYSISGLLGGAIFFVTLAAVSLAGLLLDAMKWRGRVVPVLRFVLTVFVGMLAYLALIPWSCVHPVPAQCESAFGSGLSYDGSLPAVVGGLLAAATTWLLVSLASRRVAAP